MTERAKGDELIDVVVRLPLAVIEDTIHASPRGGKSEAEVRIALAKALLTCHRRRTVLFAEIHFSDPAWEMMLELYVAAADGRQFRISKLFHRSNSSPSSALRYFEGLEERGFACRINDPDDGRSSLAAMQPKLKAAMDEWLSLLLRMLSLNRTGSILPERS